MDFASNLKRMMERAGLSQADLARLSQLSTAQVACLVNGKTVDPRLSTLVKLADALGCSLDALVGEKGGSWAEDAAAALPGANPASSRYAGHMGSVGPLEYAGHDGHLGCTGYAGPALSAEPTGQVPTSADAADKARWETSGDYPEHPRSLLEKALSESLKTLLREARFEDITVKQICEGASVSRRSFYRHFLDKYDLLNYTFYQDLCVLVPHHNDWTCWDYMPRICSAFEGDRAYYRHAYLVSGRNSFREYGATRMYPLIEHDLAKCAVSPRVRDTFIRQFYDMVYDDLEYWIRNEPEKSGEQFAAELRHNAREFAKALAESAARVPRADS